MKCRRYYNIRAKRGESTRINCNIDLGERRTNRALGSPKPGAKNNIHIPVILSESGLKDLYIMILLSGDNAT